MPIKVLISLFNCLIFALTIIRIQTITKKNSFVDGVGTGVLRLPVLFMLIGYVCILISAGLIALPVYIKRFSGLNQIISTGFFFIFCLLALYLITFHFNHRVFYTDYYFEVQSRKGDISSISWDEIVSIEKAPLAGNLIIKSSDDSTIEISSLLNGYKRFLVFMMNKCPHLQ